MSHRSSLPGEASFLLYLQATLSWGKTLRYWGDFLPRTRFQYLGTIPPTLPCYGIRPSSNISKIYIYLFVHHITPIIFLTLPISPYPYAGADRSTCRRRRHCQRHGRTWPKPTRPKLREHSGGKTKGHMLV
ncbi:hypothetical protein ASPSYDRAFT_1109585 [Aspergillus sydowii CBS 593.65]|uniref:Uncharacterized protein n=1 Tax=Aspergillus sydowii CBS 593.65 TaxID=1036612 RepID=A0A1L9TC75_9EURO|nr:uncharacterized protein ASPSYDRAFT_1109585 [Aspergillus sydowii CBS 593.65]OJJ57016.1 hypothetical protein ASPSYDRAFT_1109585 [Aspergillus sydowii CBS 593.65]